MIITGGRQRGTVATPGQSTDPPRVRQFCHDTTRLPITDFDRMILGAGDRQQPSEGMEFDPRQLGDPFQPIDLSARFKIVYTYNMIRSACCESATVRTEG